MISVQGFGDLPHKEVRFFTLSCMSYETGEVSYFDCLEGTSPLLQF